MLEVVGTAGELDPEVMRSALQLRRVDIQSVVSEKLFELLRVDALRRKDLETVDEVGDCVELNKWFRLLVLDGSGKNIVPVH